MFNKAIPSYIIVLFSALLWGGEYIRRDLWEPDEARFALVAREMREGHWIVPFRQGEFYSHKPPLMFWLINVSSLFAGGQIGNLASRLPSFLGAVMALWAVSRIAMQWFSARVGWLTVLLLPSSFLFWNKGGFGQIDMLLCGLQMMALYCLFSARGPHAARIIFCAYVFMGLGILAKGPVGLIVPLGVYITATLASGSGMVRSRWHFVWGPLVALAFPAVWLLAAWWSGAPDGFFDELLFKQNVGRLSGEFGGHVKPFYYFFYYFPLDFLPWTLALPLSWLALRRAPESTAGRKALLGWMLFVVLFFTLSASKRNLYILLAYPAAAMLVAAGTQHWMKVSPRLVRITFWLLWVLLLIIGLVMTVGSLVGGLPLNPIMLLPGGLAMLAGCWWVHDVYKEHQQTPRWLIAMSSVVLINFTLIGLLVYHEFDSLKTPKEIIQITQDNLAPQERIIMYKQQGEIFSLYTERKGQMIYSQQALTDFIHQSPQSTHVIIALERELPEIQGVIGVQYEPHRFQMGNKKLVWLMMGKGS